MQEFKLDLNRHPKEIASLEADRLQQVSEQAPVQSFSIRKLFISR